MPDKPENSPLNKYLKYSGLAFQMFAVIGMSVWLGLKIDEWVGTENPVFTVILALAGIIGSMFSVIRGLSR